ncbi:MAG: polyprenol monophosphomannose synthase [Candidatus Doudnabacteria bacterium]|nr:polyprenol monophosphomannose synthase [Candidatus Doudnabacteria bacterium]
MIIIPAYNEKENVAILVKKIRNTLGDIGILFVEDNSPDGTGAEIKKIQSSDPNVYLLERAAKSGFGSAYRQAFAWVMKNTATQFVVTMDADLSHPPEALPELIGRLARYPVVIGSRYAPGGKIENWGLFRQLLSRFGNIYARLLTGIPVADLTSGFLAFRIDWLKRLNLTSSKSEGYAFLIELKYLFRQAAAQFYEYPITFVERREGKSKFSLGIVAEGVIYPLKVLWRRLSR